MGAIDVWCNGFTLEHRTRWEKVIAAQGLALRIRTGDEDSFVEPAGMLARMDEIGFSTLLLAACEVPEHAQPFAYERYATSPIASGQMFTPRSFTMLSARPAKGAIRRSQEPQSHFSRGIRAERSWMLYRNWGLPVL